MTSSALTAAAVDRRGDAVTLTWSVVGDVPTRGTWLLSTTLVGGKDGPVHQFGVKFLDENLIAAFIYDHVTSSQQDFPDVSPARRGEEWAAVFPIVDIDIAGEGRWTATLTVDGTDSRSIGGYLPRGSI
jgi:hypothetical protein